MFNVDNCTPKLLEDAKLKKDEASFLVDKWGLHRQCNDSRAKKSDNVMDADQTLYTTRELEFVERQSYDVLYPEFLSDWLWPVHMDAPSGAERVGHESYDKHGEGEITSDEANDAPVSSVSKKTFKQDAVTIRDSARWTVHELRQEAMANMGNLRSSSNKSLIQRRLDASRFAIEKSKERAVSLGWSDEHKTIKGIYNTDSLVTLKPSNLNISDWFDPNTTADSMHQELNALITYFLRINASLLKPNTIVATTDVIRVLNDKRLDHTRGSVLNYLEMTNKKLGLQFVAYDRIDSDLENNKSRLFIYDRRPKVINQYIPQPIEMAPQDRDAFTYKIQSRMRIGGVSVKYKTGVMKVNLDVPTRPSLPDGVLD